MTKRVKSRQFKPRQAAWLISAAICCIGGVLAVVLWQEQQQQALQQQQRIFQQHSALYIEQANNWFTKQQQFFYLWQGHTNIADRTLQQSAFTGLYQLVVENDESFRPVTTTTSHADIVMPKPAVLITIPQLRQALTTALDTNKPVTSQFFTINKTYPALAYIIPADDTLLLGILSLKPVLDALFARQQGVVYTGSIHQQEIYRTKTLNSNALAGKSVQQLQKHYQITTTQTLPPLGDVLYVRESTLYQYWRLLIAPAMIVFSSGCLAILVFSYLTCKSKVEQLIDRQTKELRQARYELDQQSKTLVTAKETAIDASRAKGDFLATMSHEIRTPLNSMIGITELMLDTDLNNHQRANLRTVLSSAETLLEIINDILDFSKIESGKLTLEPITFDVHALVDDTAELFANRAREKAGKLELLTHISSTVPTTLVGDPVRLKQILCNLVSNALKFTEQGHVLIRVGVEGELSGNQLSLKFAVQDTGIGIPDDKLAAIFEKFSQADVSTTRKFGGTGLGLSISQQLSQLMGGNIGVDSVPGHGSTFWFTVKMGYPDSQASTDVVQELPGKRALIVDPNTASTAIVEDYLTTIGMTSVKAASGEAGVLILKTAYNSGRLFDILILDAGLTDTHSTKIARSIRASQAFSELPVLMLTNDGSNIEQNAFVTAGCSGFLTKPLAKSGLLRMVNTLIQSPAETTLLTPYSIMPQPAERRQVASAKPFAGSRILLVDDNRANLMFGTELLELMGCEVIQASNGQVAVDIVRNQSFDLVLMDCQMPTMDGFTASRQITELQRTAEVSDFPILALTANAMQGDREQCLAAGMRDYLTKPIRRAVLEKKLAEWLLPEGINEVVNVA